MIEFLCHRILILWHLNGDITYFGILSHRIQIHCIIKHPPELLFLYIIYMYEVCTCLCGCVHICVHLHGEQRSTSASSSIALHFLLWVESLMEPRVHSFTRLRSQWALGIHLFLSPSMLGLQIGATIPSFYVGAGDLNIGLHACMVATISSSHISSYPSTNYSFI